MQISVVIPLLNEEESIPELSAWIERVMIAHGFSYEIILIDDGSSDNSWQKIEECAAKNPNIRAIKFQRNYGKSGGLYKGFEAAQGDVVITMDADLQDSPEEIPELYRMITQDGYDMVSGWKKKRYDPVLTKNMPSKLYNATVRLLTGIHLHDFNCGLKAYKRQVIKSVEVYGEMHRYMPVLAKWAGFKKIGEKVVQHQERKYGTSKFGVERFIRGPLDLLSVLFIAKFSKRPMHLFGGLGVLCFVAGAIILAYLSYAKLALHVYNMTQRPLFFLGIICLLVGCQLFLTGFLAELISRSSASKNEYLCEKKI
ncbi:MAG: glycosyltransferase family 2 protein [Bacteroidales bacterium]|jgi:glycosyltransferase involved in cell wall biosynthesis|nr:glycosyltransferase family 2 protein [Bacteroidales bacterium]